MRARLCLEYLSQVNWSLLKAGVPLFARFAIHEIDRPIESLTLQLTLEDLLDRTRIELVPRRDLGQDLVGKVESHLRFSWNWGFSWQVTQPREAELRITLDRLTIGCPVTLLPPGAWHPAVDEADRSLRTRSLEGWFELDTPDCVRPEFAAGRRLWQGQPPLAAALAALVNPNDRDSRPDGALGRSTWSRALRDRGLEPETAGPPIDLDAVEALRAFYEAIRELRLPFVDFRKEFLRGIQTVRLRPDDRELGAVCLDLACRGCEVLEALGLGPVFLLTHGGRHAALGCWQERTGAFRNAQPVSTDALEMTASTAGEAPALHLLDVALALQDVLYEEAAQRSRWEHLSQGFVHVVDLRACRSWQVGRARFSIWPLDRGDAPAWIERYLTRLIGEVETPVPEVIYLTRDRYEKFLAKLRLAAIPEEYLIRDSDGGVLVRLQLWARGREELRGEAFASLRATALADLFLHDPASLFVPLHASFHGEPSCVAEETLAAALAQPGRRVALLADGGGGKTYLCERLAHRLAAACMAHPAGHPIVPVFFRLRDLANTPNAEILAFIAREVGCNPNDLRATTRNYWLAFILDSLEESEFSRNNHHPSSYKTLLGSLLSLENSSVLLTFRPSLFAAGDIASYLPDFQLADLESWTDAEIGTFFRRCAEERGLDFPEGWESFQRVVLGHRKLAELARTPLFARMMAATRKTLLASAIGSSADLYQHYTQECFGRRAHKVPVEVARPATERIAGLAYEQQQESLKGDEIEHTLADFRKESGIGFWREFLAREVVIHGLLVPDFRGGPQEARFRFSHLSFEHFFLAAWLAQPWDETAAAGLFGRAHLPPGVLDFLADLLRREPDRLAKLARELQSISPPRVDAFALPVGAPERAADIAFRNLILVCLRCGLALEGFDLSDLDGAASLARADLTGARLRGSNLSHSHLQAAILREADLRDCALQGADLSGADLTGTRLEGADLWRCRLSRIQGLPRLAGARNLERIRLGDDDQATLDLLLAGLALGMIDDPEAAAWLQHTRQALTARRRDLTPSALD